MTSFFSTVSLAHPSFGAAALRPRQGAGDLGGSMGASDLALHRWIAVAFAMARRPPGGEDV